MSDKEPRRRKKRKDLQSARKEEILSDDQVFGSTKMENKDSDAEVEEEITVPSYQPSVFAKFVFVLLFSGLVVSMSFVFISLQGTHRGEVELFDDHHAEESNVIHDDVHEVDHDEEHAEGDHDVEHDDDDHDEADHDDTETWSLSPGSFQENIEALLPGLGNILSFNDAPSKDASEIGEQEPSIIENQEIIEDPDIQSATVQSMTEDDIDDLDDDEELFSSQVTPPVTSSYPPEPELETTQSPIYNNIPSRQEPDEFEDDDDTTPQSVATESDYTTYSPNIPIEDEDDEEDTSNQERLPEEKSQTESHFEPEDNFINNVVEDEEIPFYEKNDITNEADYAIRQQLDELEEALEKDFAAVDDDNDDDDDDDDNDDYVGEDGVGDEFDFWQF